MIVTIKVVNNGMLSCADIGEFAGSISILPINKLLLFKPKNVGKYNKIQYKPQIHPNYLQAIIHEPTVDCCLRDDVVDADNAVRS